MNTMEQKTARNKRVQARYDQLMTEGRHGHYETMFRVVREEVEQQLAHLKTCSATEICAENPNILAYCQQVEQQLASKDDALRQSRDAFRYLAHCISNRPVLQGLIQKSLLAIDKELK